MQFQVPQFIDIEDKIFGPLTFKQFIYILGGAGAAFVIYKLIPNTTLAIITAAPIVIFALALAFRQVNGRPFIVMLEAAFKYYWSHKLFLWKKLPTKKVVQGGAELPVEEPSIFNPKLVSGKLKDLSWSLDVHEKISKEDK
ncbi:MAG: PrgI family protein [Candidatus Vogelbacteria bacterium]|nr:PrgI family protein [Candidatus Vogelbacteria bacterium]